MANGSYIGQVKIGENYYPVGSILYGVCDTAAATQDKTTVLTNYSGTDTGVLNDTSVFNDNNLTKGVTIHIKFINSNTYNGDVYLKVANATKHKIVKYSTTNIGNTAATSWVAGSIVSFTYDGTNWIMNTGIDSNDTYSAISEANIKNASNTSAGLITGQRFDQALTNRIDTSISNTSTDTQVPSAKAVYNYVDTKTSGLTGAMHFKGAVNSLPTATDTTTYSTYDAGDVILVGDKEYVYNKGQNAAGSSWILLGDEGSYALKTSTTSVGSASGWSAGSIPSLSYTAKTVKSVKTNTAGTAASLTTTTHTIPYVTAAGSATTASVTNGTLTISNGSAPTLGTPFSVKAVNVFTANTPTAIATEDIACDDITAWNAGTVPSLTVTPTTVVKP